MNQHEYNEALKKLHHEAVKSGLKPLYKADVSGTDVEQRRCRATTKKGLPCPFHWLAGVPEQRDSKLCHIHVPKKKKSQHWKVRSESAPEKLEGGVYYRCSGCRGILWVPEDRVRVPSPDCRVCPGEMEPYANLV